MSDRATPKRRPGFFSTTAFLRLAVGEAAVVGGLALSAHTRLAGAVAAPLVAATLARRRGRWWLDHHGVLRRFRRRRSAPAAGHRDPRVQALRRLAPGLTVSRGPHDTGVAYDGSGWFAIATVAADPDVFEASGTPDRLLPDLAAFLRDADIPGAAVQLVTHTVPAPHPDLVPGCAAAASYRELSDLVGSIPVDRVQWLAVRADAEALAEAGLRDPDQAPAIIAALARRAARTASRQGRHATVLDAEGLIAALARSCALDQPHAPHEEWDAWHSGRLAHRSFWLRDWPRNPDVSALLDRLALAPAAMTSLALTLRADRNSDAVDIRCLIRIGTRPSDLPRAAAALESTARAFDATVTALDGEHAPAAYASAPTGGGPR